jgi:hypothetical protein
MNRIAQIGRGATLQKYHPQEGNDGKGHCVLQRIWRGLNDGKPLSGDLVGQWINMMTLRNISKRRKSGIDAAYITSST